MKEFINKWSNWWILNPKRKQLDDVFEKELNELIKREVALRQPHVAEQSEQLVCDNCDFVELQGDIYQCTKCYKIEDRLAN